MTAPFRWPIRVYWEDTDASGVVYHANYLRWLERGRSEWLRAQGGTQQRWLDQHDIAFTVTELEIRYRKPARLDDELIVLTQVSEVRRASLRFTQVIERIADGVQLAAATVRAASVSRQTFRPCALPSGVFSVTIRG